MAGMDGEYVTCPTCGLGWFTRAWCPSCFGSVEALVTRGARADPACVICHGSGDGGLTAAHVCPEPLPYATARALADAAVAAGGLVVSPLLKARVRLGLAAERADE